MIYRKPRGGPNSPSRTNIHPIQIDLARGRRDRDSLAAQESALGNLCDLLIQTRALERALPICLEVAGRQPPKAEAFYNLAGAQALSGRAEQALVSLARDFDLGDRDWEYLAKDAWFESLRGDGRFTRLLERMKQTPP